MAAKTPTMNASRTSMSAKYFFSRPAPSSVTSFQAARRQTGVRIAAMTMSDRAMPSTPSA